MADLRLAVTASSTGPSDRERGPDEVFCRNCGAIISEAAEICPECGVRQKDPPRSSVDSALDDLFEGGNPFVAAVLSAHVLRGRAARGVALAPGV